MVATSQIAALSDAYKPALLIYNGVKAQNRTPQNQTFLNEFGARFARGPADLARPARVTERLLPSSAEWRRWQQAG